MRAAARMKSVWRIPQAAAAAAAAAAEWFASLGCVVVVAVHGRRLPDTVDACLSVRRLGLFVRFLPQWGPFVSRSAAFFNYVSRRCEQYIYIYIPPRRDKVPSSEVKERRG